MQASFKVSLDGVTKFTKPNPDAQSFKNVRVFAVFENSVPANAVLKNLEYINNN